MGFVDVFRCFCSRGGSADVVRVRLSPVSLKCGSFDLCCVHPNRLSAHGTVLHFAPVCTCRCFCSRGGFADVVRVRLRPVMLTCGSFELGCVRPNRLSAHGTVLHFAPVCTCRCFCSRGGFVDVVRVRLSPVLLTCGSFDLCCVRPNRLSAHGTVSHFAPVCTCGCFCSRGGFADVVRVRFRSFLFTERYVTELHSEYLREQIVDNCHLNIQNPPDLSV